MILVLSFDRYEQGTDPVIDWLLYYKADFVKITIQDLIQQHTSFRIDINQGRIYVEDTDITDAIEVVWYRRFEDDLHIDMPKNKHTDQAITELSHEVAVTITYLKRILAHKKWMPHHNAIQLEKPEITFLSQQYGLRTPQSIITNSKADVIAFRDTIQSDLIIKPIRHSSYFIDDPYTYSIYTTKLTEATLAAVPDRFVLTLFQECIDAAYEIRVFYLDGAFYATAIIVNTPLDEDSSSEVVDIKLSYESAHINWVPYQLPEAYQEQLHGFMQSINLNTGSLDILKTPSGDYILLEINPVGQYSAPGYRCNYNLEEKIAKWLIRHDQKENNTANSRQSNRENNRENCNTGSSKRSHSTALENKEQKDNKRNNKEQHGVYRSHAAPPSLNV